VSARALGGGRWNEKKRSATQRFARSRRPTTMNVRRSLVAVSTFALLATACSSPGDDPPELPGGPGDLTSRLEADLGVGVTVESDAASVFVLPRAATRIVAAHGDEAHEVDAWIASYAADLGLPPEHSAAASDERDGVRTVHVTPRLGAQVVASDAGVDVLLDHDGRLLGLVSDRVPSGFDARPVIDEATARATAFPGGTSAISALVVRRIEGTLGVFYRVENEGAVAWVDAKSGAVRYVDGDRGASVAALSSRHYSDVPSLKVAGHRLDIEVDGMAPPYKMVRTGVPGISSTLEVGAFDGFSKRKGVMMVSAPLVSSDPSVWDTGNRHLPNHEVWVDGAAVDALHNALRADRYLRARGPVRVKDRGVRIAAHCHFRKKVTNTPEVELAMYSPAADIVCLGDGGSGFSDRTQDRLPLGAALDVVTHEMVHHLLRRDVHSYEEMAFEEGLADVTGQLAEHANAIPGARPDRFGEGSFVGSRGMRNLARPDVVLPGSLVFGGSSAHTKASACAGKIFPTSEGEAPNGCYYSDSHVTSYAWYLMTFGGPHVGSRVDVGPGLGWAASEALWAAMLGTTIEPGLGLPPIVLETRTPLAAARKQLAAVRAIAPAALGTVACAWNAVGVLDDESTRNVLGRACERAEMSCVGKADGVYCDPRSTFAAYRCVNGAIGASPPPCPSGRSPAESLACTPVDGILGHRAKLDAQGKLVCSSPIE
jgi:hypothetical protein